MSDKKYFVFLGCSGFPYGLAEVKKMTLISKSLNLSGNPVTIICENGVHKQSDYPDMKAADKYEGIDYVYTSGSPFRPESFIKRNLLKSKGIINEAFVLKRMKKNKELDYAILSTNSSKSIFYYFILSKLLGFKTILNHVEYYSRIKFKPSNAWLWLKNKVYDNYMPLCVDIAFPISEFLINHLTKISPRKKYLKVPILTEFENYDNVQILQEPNYFLFCGSYNYYEIVEFIIDSFNLIKSSSAYLYLVIKGEEKDLVRIRGFISNSPKAEKIKVFSSLNDQQLYNYYKSATALLIPLRPTLQDEARFPFKIGEYLGSENPVVSTNYGEVKHYFKDLNTMLIADKYDLNQFADKMQYVLDHPLEAKQIGKNGKRMALENFDYKPFAQKLINFLEKIPS